MLQFASLRLDLQKVASWKVTIAMLTLANIRLDKELSNSDNEYAELPTKFHCFYGAYITKQDKCSKEP